MVSGVAMCASGGNRERLPRVILRAISASGRRAWAMSRREVGMAGVRFVLLKNIPNSAYLEYFVYLCERNS